MNKKNVYIIGAGLGGLATGVLLTKKGYEVEVFEKEKILGGRALTLDGNTLTLDEYQKILHRFNIWLPFSEPDVNAIFERNMLHGYKFDLGFHLLGFIDKSPIMRILNSFDEHVEISSSRFGLIHPEKGVMNSLRSYLTTYNKMKLLPLAARLLSASKSTISGLQNVSLNETLDKYCKGQIKDILGIAGKLIATMNDLDKISTSETIRVLRQWVLGARRAGSYPRSGTMALSQGFANIIQRNKGNINFGTKITQIIYNKDNKVNGVEIEGENKQCDIVVSNLPVQDLFSITSEKCFPSEYVKKMKSLEGTGSVCAYYSLKKIDPNLIGIPFAFVELDLDVEGGDAAGVIDFQTADPANSLSPENRYLVQAYIICSPKEALDKKKVGMLREVLDEKMEVLIPGFRDNLDFALYPTSWRLDGVAKTIENEKPEPVTPLKNLYIVGDCVKSTGIGMNCAVDSAIRLLGKI